MQAATTTWIAGSGNWEDAANWSAGVPQLLNTAVLTATTDPTFIASINAATTIAGLNLTNARLIIAADLTVTGSSSWSHALEPFGGTITFRNSSSVRLAGPFSVTGNGAKGLNATGVLDLSGATTWTGNTSAGGNSLTIGIGPPTSVLRNRSVFTDSNAFDTTITGRGTFDNQGNFVKSGASVTRVDVTNFNNSGSVNIGAGTLVLPNLSGVQTGSWQVNAGAVIDFTGGTPTLLGTLGGSGTLRISGGTVTVEGFGRNVPMLLDGGTLAGSFQVFDGPFTWRTGSLAGTAAGDGVTLFTGSVTLEGSDAKVIGSGREVTTFGQTTWTGGPLTIGQDTAPPSTFINNGVFRDSDVGNRTLSGPDSSNSRFVNAGTYLKTGDGRTGAINLPFDNQGALDVRAGLMEFSLGLTNSGLIQTVAGGGVLVKGATSGLLANTGTLAGHGGIGASRIINRGLISPGSPGSSIGALATGTLTLETTTLTLAPEGSLKIELAGPGFNDLLRVSGTVVLGGMLDLWSVGYAPRVGDSFEVLQFASRSGMTVFDAVQFNGFDPAVTFDVLYGAAGVRLVVTAVPEPGTAALWLAGLAMIGALARRRVRAGSAAP